MAGDYYADETNPAYDVHDARSAAFSVAITIALGVFVLWGMRKSGFRAMVAVGRG